MTSTLRPRPAHRPAWLPGLMLLALLWVQSLGLVHRVLHAPLDVGPALIATADRDASERAGPGGLLGHARHDAACLLFDHLTVGESVLAAAVAAALPAVIEARLERPDGSIRSAAAPVYHARAPPSQD